MAEPVRAEAAAAVTVTVVVDGREPDAMFELVELTATVARLRSPLLLEIGEHVGLRLRRGERTLDVEGRVASIVRDGGEPITIVELIDGPAVAPLLA